MLMASVMIVMSCNEVEETDVLIVGGGASGISAGLQSARMGVRTVIIEETPWLGGMLTSAGVLSCIIYLSYVFYEPIASISAMYP